MADLQEVLQRQGIKAIKLIKVLRTKISKLVLAKAQADLDKVKVDEALTKYCLALLSGLASQWSHAYAPVCLLSVSLLQQALFCQNL